MFQLKQPGRASKFSLPRPFYSIQTLDRLDEAHLHREGDLLYPTFWFKHWPNPETSLQTYSETTFSQLSVYPMIQSGRHNIKHRILQTLKYTNASVQLPRHSHLIGVNYSLGIKIFKSSPGDFNVWPKLRTTNIIDHLSPDEK